MKPQVNTPKRLRFAGVALAALVPIVPLVFVVVMNTPRDEVIAQSVRLTGDWRILESAAEGQGAIDVDDSGWQTASLPGNLYTKGFEGQHHWLRRSVTLDQPVTGASLFLMLGNLRYGIAELYVNGQYVGRNQSFLADAQPDFTHVAGWEVPGALVHSGANVVAMHVYWFYTPSAGVFDDRMLLGPTKLLQPFFARIIAGNWLLAYGSLFMCLLLVGLLGILLRAAERKDRGRLWAAMALVGASAQILFWMVGGTALLGHFPSASMEVIEVGSTQVGVVAYLGFTEHWALGRVTWFQRFTWVASVGLIVGSFVSPVTVEVQAVLALFSTVYIMATGIRGVVRDPRWNTAVVGFSLITPCLAAISDVLGSLGLSSLPTLFTQASTNLALTVAVLLINEFIDISRQNKSLSSSLAQTNVELRSALVKAQESTRLKQDLLATVSHELRTPLNAIVNLPEGLLEDFPVSSSATCTSCGAVSMNVEVASPCPSCGKTGALTNSTRVEYTGEPAHAAKYLSMVLNSGRHLMQIVDDIMDYSRLNAASLTLTLERIDLQPLIRDLLLTIAPSAKAAQVALEATDAPPTPLNADPQRLRQVLTNLLTNAVKFSPPGRAVSLRVKAEGPVCVFEVEDHGIGISEDNQPLVFESFRQLDSGHTRRAGGTGLGLSIARELVMLHGGDIALRSQLGVGTTFTVRLPFAGPQAAARA